MAENEIAKEIVDAAYYVHKRLGLGLLESVYEIILAYELKKRVVKVERQVPVAIVFDGIKFSPRTNLRWHIKRRKRPKRITWRLCAFA